LQVDLKTTNSGHQKEEQMNFERTTLAATQLYQLAAQEKIKLSQLEKDRLTTDYLFVLAITNTLELNQHD
jgi:hypothetical protein